MDSRVQLLAIGEIEKYFTLFKLDDWHVHLSFIETVLAIQTMQEERSMESD